MMRINLQNSRLPSGNHRLQIERSEPLLSDHMKRFAKALVCFFLFLWGLFNYPVQTLLIAITAVGVYLLWEFTE